MNIAVISDLHLGSHYCRCEEFMLFVRRLPQHTWLVLNGDVVHGWHTGLEEEHGKALDLLREESQRRPVIWVRGNHDDGYELERPGRIELAPHFSLGKRLFVAHGYDFDNVMPKNRAFIRVFRFLHHVRIRLGAQPVHVAFYAKRFPLLYNVLRRSVAANAVEFARENGYAAVTCGHTHFFEDTVQDGIRYINTGSWTEEPIHCLLVSDTEMRPARVDEIL